MKYRLAIILVLLLIPAALFSQTVDLRFDQERQTILHNGINFEGYHWMPVMPASLIATHEKMLATMKCQLLRIAIPLPLWEPANDNASPTDMNIAAFSDTGEMHKRFLYFKSLKDRGYDLWFTPFDAPNWMVTNPTQSQGRLLRSADEFVEGIVAFLVHARKNYGFEARYLSLNEPAIGMLLNISSWSQVEIVKKLGPRLSAEGLTPKWIVCSHQWDSANLAYVRTVYSDPAVRPYVAGFDFHGYRLDQLAATDSSLIRWSRWTDSTGLFSLCGELDYNVSFWLATNPNSWVHAQPTGRVFFKALNEGRSVGALPWYVDAADTSRPYRFVAKHFQQYLTPGYKVCATTSSSPSLLSLAAKKDSAFVVFLQNESSASASVTLQNLPPIRYAWISSYNGRYYHYNGQVTVTAGQATVSLPAVSLNTLAPYDSTAPAVSGLNGAPVGPYRVQLSWPRALDPESDISGYVIFRDGVRIDTLGPDTVFLDQGLKELTGYRYEVMAVNGHNVEGSLSAPVTVTTDRDTAGPALVSVSARDSLSVVVTFSEAVDSASALSVVNYAAIPPVTWAGAVREAPDRIRLTPSIPLRPRASYKITIQSVKDASAARNVMAQPALFLFAVPLVVVDFGASAASTFIGSPGWAVIKDTYTDYTSLGPDGMNMARSVNGAYNFQGVSGTGDSLDLKPGDRFEVHWYNDQTAGAAFTPRINFSYSGRLSSAPAGTTFNMTGLSLPAKGSGTTTFTVSGAAAGMRGVVNVSMMFNNSGTLVCDKILLFPVLDSTSMRSEDGLSAQEAVSISPNPFNPCLTLRVKMPDRGPASRQNVRLRIMNSSGQLVHGMERGVAPGSALTLTWDASSLPSGLYVLHITAGRRAYTRRAVLIR